QLMVRIGNCPDGGQTAGKDQPDFPRGQFYGYELAVPCDQLGKGACTTGHDGSLARPELQTGYNGTQGYLGQWKSVPYFRGNPGPRGNLLSYLQSVLGNDVFLFPIGVFHQGDKGRSVGVVLNGLHCGLHTLFVPLEIDDTISPFVTTAPMAHGHLSLTVPTTCLF